MVGQLGSQDRRSEVIVCQVPYWTREQCLRALEAMTAPYVERYLGGVTDPEAEARRLSDQLTPELMEMDARRERQSVQVRLEALGPEWWPRALLDCYRRSSRYEARRHCVYQAIFLARCSATARELGLAALHDRSKTVRWRAHQVLAYSLDRSVLPALLEALEREEAPDLCDSLRAAIIAIEAQNHHFYKDPEKRGNVTWAAHPWECRDPAVLDARLNIEIERRTEAWQTAWLSEASESHAR